MCIVGQIPPAPLPVVGVTPPRPGAVQHVGCALTRLRASAPRVRMISLFNAKAQRGKGAEEEKDRSDGGSMAAAMPAIRPHRAPAGRATPPHPFTSVARATSAGVTALAGPRCHSTPSMNGARQPSTNGATQPSTNEHWSCTNRPCLPIGPWATIRSAVSAGQRLSASTACRNAPSTNGATHATTNEHWSCTNAAILTPCQVSSGTALSAAHPPAPRRDALPDGPPSWVIGTGVLCAFASLRLCVQKRAPAFAPSSPRAARLLTAAAWLPHSIRVLACAASVPPGA